MLRRLLVVAALVTAALLWGWVGGALVGDPSPAGFVSRPG